MGGTYMTTHNREQIGRGKDNLGGGEDGGWTDGEGRGKAERGGVLAAAGARGGSSRRFEQTSAQDIVIRRTHFGVCLYDALQGGVVALGSDQQIDDGDNLVVLRTIVVQCFDLDDGRLARVTLPYHHRG